MHLLNSGWSPGSKWRPIGGNPHIYERVTLDGASQPLRAEGAVIVSDVSVEIVLAEIFSRAIVMSADKDRSCFAMG